MRTTECNSSVEDVEGVPQRRIHLGPGDAVEASNRRPVEHRERHRDQTVADNHTGLRKSLCGTNLNLASDAPDRSSDCCAGHRRENVNRCVPGEHTYGASAEWRAKVGPDHVTSGYHAGSD